ncbi:MAG: hypothetical protein ACEPOV_06165 [Hyphomicrobiales bacterium]
MPENEIVDTPVSNLENVLPELMAIPADQIKRPNMPTEKAVQEAETQHTVAKRYEKQLLDVGLTTETIDELKTRAGILSQAEAEWRINNNAHQDAVKNWDDAKDRAIELRKKLNRSFRHAYESEDRIMGRIREFCKGTGDENLIQDLSEFGRLGKANPSQLEAINFELSNLDDAIELHDNMRTLHAAYQDQKYKQREYKDIRDRAFTYMKLSLDAVRKSGKYAFADNPRIAQEFTSEYDRSHRRKKQDDENDPSNTKK